MFRSGWLVAALILLAVSPSLANRTVALSTWFTQLQTLGAKHRKGDTDVQKGAAFAEFVAAVSKEHDGKRIQFVTSIKNVTWRDGVATIHTESERKAVPRTAAAPLRIYRTTPFEARMTQEQAASIKVGAQMRFTGTVTFNPRQMFAGGAKSQSISLYTVTHTDLSPHVAGIFTSSDATFQIGGRQYDHPWAAQAEEKEKEKE